MFHGGGAYGGVRVLGERTVQTMTAPQVLPGGGIRSLGWDMQSGYSSNRGETFSQKAFGHGGFTGTVLWIDPELELTVVFLSNRVHPDGKGVVNGLAGRIGTIAASAVLPHATTKAEAPTSPQTAPVTPTPIVTTVQEGLVQSGPVTRLPEVRTGIDVLKRDRFAALKGRKVALITNHTGLDRDGNSTIDLLHKAPGVKLHALYSPEHGIRGELDVPNIGDSKDAKTGLPVYSLYGKVRKPTKENLNGVDTLVYDIQDVGARFYTFISTLGLAMEAAAEHKLRFVVLDRPNPIGGVTVAGPMLDPGKESFVAFHRLPVQHGLTVGELAELFRRERKLSLDLQVIPVEGWARGDQFDATGLIWVNPSPNMRSLTEAVLYPGIGLLETTNLSVGRGTDTPFEVIGAPWLDGRKLAAALFERKLPGVRFVPVRFTPKSSKFKGVACGGVNIEIVDRQAFSAIDVGVEIAVALRRLYPKDWDVAGYMRLLGNAATLQGIEQGSSSAALKAAWRPDLEQFIGRRREVLLYH
jgi:uncharacterized protein YbbC (DUF1343 family)